jgi:hypothetical protein
MNIKNEYLERFLESKNNDKNVRLDKKKKQLLLCITT